MKRWPEIMGGTLFVLFPFSVLLGGQVHDSQTMGVMILGAVALAYLAPSRPAGLFLLLSAFWVVATRFMVLTTGQPAYLRYGQAVNGFWHLALGIGIYAAVARLVKRDRLTVWLDIVCASALLMVLWTILQGLGLDPLLDRAGHVPKVMTNWQLGALAGHPNFLAAYLAVCLPCFWRPGWWWALPVVGVVLLAQQTTGGVLAAGAGLGYLAWRKWGHDRLFWWGLCAAVVWGLVVVVVADPLKHSMASRLTTWGMAISDPSVLGHGVGSWSLTLATKAKNGWVFNEYLQTFFEVGAAGLTFVAWLLWRVLRSQPSGETTADKWSGWIVKASLIAIAVDAGVNPFFRVPITGLLGALILGLWEVTYVRRDICADNSGRRQ